jgi:hypothetical protein
MSPFRDPEWQLHIPQKEDTTIVLTHLCCISTEGPVVGSQGALIAGPLLSAPESGGGASGVSAEEV